MRDTLEKIVLIDLNENIVASAQFSYSGTMFYSHARNLDLYVGTDDSRSVFRASSANFRMQCNLQTSLFSSLRYRLQLEHTSAQFLNSCKSKNEKITSRTVSGNWEAIPSVIALWRKRQEKQKNQTRFKIFFVSRKDCCTVPHSKQNNAMLTYSFYDRY